MATSIVLLKKAEKFGFTRDKLAIVLGVSERTIRRWEKRENKPSPLAKSKLDELTEILNEIEETFESREKGIKWLTTPNRSLGGKTPLEVLLEKNGIKKISTLLGRLRWGIPD